MIAPSPEPLVFTATPATDDSYFLGECPVWDPLRGRLLWVDIEDGTVHEGTLDADDRITGRILHRTGSTAGAVAVSADGDLLIAERAVLTRVGSRGTRTELTRVLPPGRPRRLNDGACDPAGRFVVGSRASDDHHGEEVLVRLGDTGLTVLDSDLTLSNGLAWSPTGDRFYSVDSIPGVVYVRDYDPVTGDVDARTELLSIDNGVPDGLCVDGLGNLWVAVWGAGQVQCYTPDGTLRAVVDVAAPHTTSAAFAGPDLDVLVITTAREDLTPADLVDHPDSGRLFVAHVDVAGLPTPYWSHPARPLSRSTTCT